MSNSGRIIVQDCAEIDKGFYYYFYDYGLQERMTGCYSERSNPSIYLHFDEVFNSHYGFTKSTIKDFLQGIQTKDLQVIYPYKMSIDELKQKYAEDFI